MPKIYVARKPQRKALLVPTGGAGSAFILGKQIDNSELDELVKAVLEKKGINEKEATLLAEKGEAEYEERQKVQEAKGYLRKLMGYKEEGWKLFPTGFRRWQPASYRPIRVKGGR